LLRSNQFLLLGKHLWLSNRPLLPPLLQQEALFHQKWVVKAKRQQHNQQFRAFSLHLVERQALATHQFVRQLVDSRR
jgi:hypothetical protein